MALGHLHVEAVGTFGAFLLELEAIDLPVGDVGHAHFAADVMLQGHAVDAARGLGLADVHTGRGIGIRRPDVLDGAATAVGDPEAPVLVVPGLVLALDIDRGGRGARGAGEAAHVETTRAGGCVRVDRDRLAQGAVAADEFDVIQVGLGAGLPFQADRAVVVSTGEDADAVEDVVAARVGFDHRDRAAEAAERGLALGQDELGGVGVQADELGLGTELEGAGQAVPARRDVDHLVFGDGFLEGLGIVGNAVTLGTVFLDADPGLHARKGAQVLGQRSGSLGDGVDFAFLADGRFRIGGSVGHAVGKMLDVVGLALAGNGLLAGFVVHGNRDVAAGNVLEVDQVRRNPFDGDLDGRVGDILKEGFLDIDDVAGVVVAFIGDRHVLDMHADEGGAEVLAQDGRFLLAFEIGIHDHDRPARGRAAGNDAVLSAEEAQVFDFVAEVPDARQCIGSQLEINVAEETVLGEVALDTHGLGIALPDADVHVGNRAVEGTRTRVGGTLSLTGEPSREPDHVVALGLVARSIVRQVDDRALLAVADHADVAGDRHGLGDPVFAFRDVQDAEIVFDLDVVDGLLQGSRDVGFAVCLETVILGGEENGFGIFRTEGVHRVGGRHLRRKDGCTGHPKQYDGTEDFFHRWKGFKAKLAFKTVLRPS